MIHWWNVKRKRRKEAHKGIKMNFWCVWQNRKSLLWVSNAPFNESLSWIYNSSLHFFFRQAAANEKIFSFSAGIRCVFPIALRTFPVKENIYEHVRNFMNRNHRRMIPLRISLAFVYFLFMNDFRDFLVDVNSIWIVE